MCNWLARLFNAHVKKNIIPRYAHCTFKMKHVCFNVIANDKTLMNAKASTLKVLEHICKRFYFVWVYYLKIYDEVRNTPIVFK